MKNVSFPAFRAIVLLVLALAVFASAALNTARPSVNGKLHVQGIDLYDEGGNPVILRGASTHGLAWFPQFVNHKLFKQLSSEWRQKAFLFFYCCFYYRYRFILIKVTGYSVTCIRNES